MNYLINQYKQIKNVVANNNLSIVNKSNKYRDNKVKKIKHKKNSFFKLNNFLNVKNKIKLINKLKINIDKLLGSTNNIIPKIINIKKAIATIIKINYNLKI